MDTPLPDTGRQRYQEKTGKEWPHKGWWGREESLDTTIFDMPVIPSVIADYHKEKADPNTAVVMLTGRIVKLGHMVNAILDSKGLTFDGYYYNRGGSTDVEKIKTMEVLLNNYTEVEEIQMFDDRLAHIPIFEQWGKQQCQSGRLKYFSVSVVVSANHN